MIMYLDMHPCTIESGKMQAVVFQQIKNDVGHRAVRVYISCHRINFWIGLKEVSYARATALKSINLDIDTLKVIEGSARIRGMIRIRYSVW